MALSATGPSTGHGFKADAYRPRPHAGPKEENPPAPLINLFEYQLLFPNLRKSETLAYDLLKERARLSLLIKLIS